jgi:2-amino-4-hydroxy-6-hydroxymethyldihydropteridine diphosphokinase
MSGTAAFIGLGGNVGDAAGAMRAAIGLLEADYDTDVIAVSSLYRTPPWGRTDQPDFLNAAVAVETRRGARQLLELCLHIETALHRVRAERWGPRTIDLDLLVYGDTAIDEPGLQVPHPRLTERAFVLVPLAELAPDLRVSGLPVAEWLALVDPAGIVREAGGDWWRQAG